MAQRSDLKAAVAKVKEIMAQQNPVPAGLRVGVVGGGCSGFSYHMAFDNQENATDNIYQFDGLKVLVDQMSEMYLDGVSIDYIETIEGACHDVAGFAGGLDGDVDDRMHKDLSARGEATYRLPS